MNAVKTRSYVYHTLVFLFFHETTQLVEVKVDKLLGGSQVKRETRISLKVEK